MGNRSLDDFLGGDDEETDSLRDEQADESSDPQSGESDETPGERSGESAESGATETEGAVDGDVAVPSGEVEPAASTYVGRPGECGACGQTVQRRWDSDEGAVCPECKSW